MTDKELLELAAKAAGYDVKPHCNYKHSRDLVFAYRGANWNPLTDDGDALRLAVKLFLRVRIQKWGRSIADNDATHGQRAERHEGDPYAATRRVIVRAAAEIGKAMQ